MQGNQTDLQGSEKWFVVESNHNLEDDVFITFCHLMILVLAGRNDPQLWRSTGISPFIKTWITLYRTVPLYALWSTRKHSSRNYVNNSLIKDWDRWNGKCEKPKWKLADFCLSKAEKGTFAPCHLLQPASSQTRFCSGSFENILT